MIWLCGELGESTAYCKPCGWYDTQGVDFVCFRKANRPIQGNPWQALCPGTSIVGSHLLGITNALQFMAQSWLGEEDDRGCCYWSVQGAAPRLIDPGDALRPTLKSCTSKLKSGSGGIEIAVPLRSAMLVI